MAPMVHRLEAEYYGRILFTYLDADDPRTQVFQSELGFFYQPEIYLLDGNGAVIQKFIGPVAEETLRNLFDTNLQ
jgi:thioredoxin-like negative regulator of GroEL